LQPYLKSTQIFQCPSDSGSPDIYTSGGVWNGKIRPYVPQYTDYYYNRQMNHINEATFDSASLTVMFGDGDGSVSTNPYIGSSRYSYTGCSATTAVGGGPSNSCGTSDSSHTTPTPTNTITDPDGNALARHLDGANYCFADGHVKWLKGEYDSATNTSSSSAVWNLRVRPEISGGKATFGVN